jgi:hypothetical protein
MKKANIQPTVNTLSNIAVNTLLAGGIGYLCTRIFTKIPPVHGGILAGTTILIKMLVMDRIFNKIFNGPGATDMSRATGHILSTAASMAIGTVVSTAIGFPIGFEAGLIVWGSCIAGTALVTVAVFLMVTVSKQVSRSV